MLLWGFETDLYALSVVDVVILAGQDAANEGDGSVVAAPRKRDGFDLDVLHTIDTDHAIMWTST